MDGLLGGCAVVESEGRLIPLAGVVCLEPGEGGTTQIELASGSVMKVSVPYEVLATAIRQLHRMRPGDGLLSPGAGP